MVITPCMTRRFCSSDVGVVLSYYQVEINHYLCNPSRKPLAHRVALLRKPIVYNNESNRLLAVGAYVALRTTQTPRNILHHGVTRDVKMSAHFQYTLRATHALTLLPSTI